MRRAWSGSDFLSGLWWGALEDLRTLSITSLHLITLRVIFTRFRSIKWDYDVASIRSKRFLRSTGCIDGFNAS